MRALLLAVFSFLVVEVCSKGPIKNVVVLMLENRAFDHMLGHLYAQNPDIDGLTGKESNPINPNKPDSKRIPVTMDAPWQIILNPGHDLISTEIEIWGSETEVADPPMNGFIWELYNGSDWHMYPRVMMAYNATTVPAISTLAMEFTLFDRWHASCPCDTEPNRMYALSGTSHGAATNIVGDMIIGYPQRTIFDDFFDAGLDFGIFYRDFPSSLILDRVRLYPMYIKFFDDFLAQAANGTLPSFSFLEPRYFDFLLWFEEDEHPHYEPDLLTGDVAYGEFLIKLVYDALRQSPQWEETLFIVTYDEHGGFYDHVPPPQDGIPNPDGINTTDPGPFNFTRLGLRVPFIAISPWAPQGMVVHEPPYHHWDHTSLLSTLREIFELPQPPLSAREAWAPSFLSYLNLTAPRKDCPETLPIPKGRENDYNRWVQANMMDYLDDDFVNRVADLMPERVKRSGKLSDLQKSLVEAAAYLYDTEEEFSQFVTQHEGAAFVRSQIKKWKAAHKH